MFGSSACQDTPIVFFIDGEMRLGYFMSFYRKLVFAQKSTFPVSIK